MQSDVVGGAERLNAVQSSSGGQDQDALPVCARQGHAIVSSPSAMRVIVAPRAITACSWVWCCNCGREMQGSLRDTPRRYITMHHSCLLPSGRGRTSPFLGFKLNFHSMTTIALQWRNSWHRVQGFSPGYRNTCISSLYDVVQ